MAFNPPKQAQNLDGNDEILFPMSPTSQCLSSSIISLTILVVAELETLIDDSETIEMLHDVFLPLNRRFSSIIDVDEKGSARWKKVDVRVEDHIIVPTFPKVLTTINFSEMVSEYVSKIAGEPLSPNKPLWEFHLVKNPTMNGAAGSVVFKFSHALGDGYSIMSVLYSVLRRADDPSLPLTLPNISLEMTRGKKSLLGFVTMCINTIYDLSFSVMKGSVLEDSKTAVRSGMPGVEFKPIAISSIFISMEHLRHVKSMVGGTVNDVVTGMIYYMIHLYMIKKNDISNGTKMNLLVMFNMRMLRGYKNIADMIKANAWGNHVAFVNVPIPCVSGEEKADPLDFIIKAKEAMERKKNSMFTQLTNPIISLLRVFRGPNGVSQYVHANFRNTTATVTNLVGPKEKMALAGHAVSSCYFIAAGIPQSLIFTVASCTGQLCVTATMEKNFIDSQLFKSCMKEAFENIFDAACAGGRSP